MAKSEGDGMLPTQEGAKIGWQAVAVAAWCLWLGFYTGNCEGYVAEFVERSTPEATLSRALARLEVVDVDAPSSDSAALLQDREGNGVDRATSDLQLIAWILAGTHPTDDLLRHDDLNPAHLELDEARKSELRGIGDKLQSAAGEYLMHSKSLADPADDSPHFLLPAPDGRQYKAEDWLGGARRIACQEAHVLFKWFASVGCRVEGGAESRVVRRMTDSTESVLLGLAALSGQR